MTSHDLNVAVARGLGLGDPLVRELGERIASGLVAEEGDGQRLTRYQPVPLVAAVSWGTVPGVHTTHTVIVVGSTVAWLPQMTVQPAGFWVKLLKPLEIMYMVL